MKIVFTTQGTDWDAAMEPRFGHTPYLFLYDDETEDVMTVDNRDVEEEAHGAGPRTAQKLAKMDAHVLVTGNGPGGNAGAVLHKLGTTVYVGARDMTVREALAAYKAGELDAV